MASNYRDPRRKREFWEPQDYDRYLGGAPPPERTAPAPYETPGLDIKALQEQAMYLPTKAYEKGVAALGSRMAKRKMGRSGAYVEGELDKMRKYLLDMGPSADIAFRGAELAQKERQFDKQLELEWGKLGLNQQEIADRKEMFYSQQKQLSEQFNRDYTLRETEAMNRHQEELGRQNLTQQEIDNEMIQFDQQLSWEKEHYGMTLTEEKRQFNETLAFQLQQLAQTGEIEFGKLNETIRQFDEEMKRLLELDEFEMLMQERGMDLEEWQVRKQAELEQIKLDMMNNEIFGYWDEGFGPDQFTGEKYVWDDDLKNWVATPEYDRFLTEHYNKGALDLREWEIQIEAMLGMRGMQPGEEDTEEQVTSEIWGQIDTLQDELGILNLLLSNPAIMEGITSSGPWAQYANWSPERLKAKVKELKEQIKALRDQVSPQAPAPNQPSGPTLPGGG